MNVGFPYRLGPAGSTETADDERHIKDMLELLLLTSAGERVNLPAFGGGLNAMLFEPAHAESAAALQQTLRAEVLQWMHDVIDLQDLKVTCSNEDGGTQIMVELSYTLRDGTPQSAAFSYSA